MRVHQLLPIVLIFLALASVSHAVIYVDRNASGTTHDGTTWGKAYQTITAALAAASEGSEIWVADGTYVDKITMKQGVSLYGGFLGPGRGLRDRAVPAQLPESCHNH
jgi:hypothetical protein